MILPKLIWRPQTIFFHLTTFDIWLLDKCVPWRVGWEKDLVTMEVFIEALTKTWCHGSWCLCVHMYLQLLSPSHINFVLFSIVYGTLMMNVIHCGFYGLLFMLVSIADDTFSQWKKTLLYLTQDWLLCARLIHLWHVQVCPTSPTSRMMMNLFGRWQSNIVSNLAFNSLFLLMIFSITINQLNVYFNVSRSMTVDASSLPNLMLLSPYMKNVA